MKLFLTIMFFIQQKVTEIGKFLLSILYGITVKPVKAIRRFNFKLWWKWNKEDVIILIMIAITFMLLLIVFPTLLGEVCNRLYNGCFVSFVSKSFEQVWAIGLGAELAIILLIVLGVNVVSYIKYPIIPWIQDNWKQATKRANKTLKKRNKK